MKTLLVRKVRECLPYDQVGFIPGPGIVSIVPVGAEGIAFARELDGRVVIDYGYYGVYGDWPYMIEIIEDQPLNAVLDKISEPTA